MRFFVHREARPWVPNEEDLSVIQSFFGDRLPEGKLWIWPRRMVDQIYGKTSKPFAFRAFTRKNESHIFVDPSETKESVSFLMAHELCHQVVNQTPTLSMAFADSRPLGPRPEGDLFHHLDAEERFCDGVANRLLGTRYDRSWWRTQIGKRS